MRKYLLIQSKENLFIKETAYLEGKINGKSEDNYLLSKQHEKYFKINYLITNKF